MVREQVCEKEMGELTGSNEKHTSKIVERRHPGTSFKFFRNTFG